MALAGWEMMWAQRSRARGWGLRRGQAQRSAAVWPPRTARHPGSALAWRGSCCQDPGLADSWLCWEWVGPKNPSSPGSWLSEWGTGRRNGARHQRLKATAQQLKGPHLGQAPRWPPAGTTPPACTAPGPTWDPVLSHGQDDLCQELQGLALYICDNFLSERGGGRRP